MKPRQLAIASRLSQHMTQHGPLSESPNRAQRTRNSDRIAKLSIGDIDTVAPKMDYRAQKIVIKIRDSTSALAVQNPNTAICPLPKERDANGSISHSAWSSRGQPATWNNISTTNRTITGIGTSDLATASCTTLAGCCICLEFFRDDDPVRETECHHVHHARCLEKWLRKYRARCPLCQRAIGISKESQA